MIRLIFRLGFWSALALLAMPSSRDQVMDHGFAPQSLVSAFDLALGDVGNFCTKNVTMCDSATNMTSEIALVAKGQLIEAYHGVRTQFDAPDQEIMTGSIRKQPEQP